MKKYQIIILLALIAALFLIIAPLVGMKATPISAIIHRTGVESVVFWDIRLPRVLTAFLAGAALAVSGMAFQAMFRNPLATESTLGVASGASFGAAVAVRLGLSFTLLGISATSMFAFVGAMLSISLVYALTRLKRGFSTLTMLLSGVAISFFFSSLILFVQSVSDFNNSYKLLRWLMGGLGTVGYESMMSAIPFVLLGSAIILYMTHELNLLATGDDIAAGRGVDVNRVKAILFFATSLTVGGVVAICGPIGFVGMIVPHICRLLVGSDHKYLTPATILLGGAFLVGCDTIARTVTAPAEMPVGAITAFLGGPFFIWLLISGTPQRKRI